jgi:protein-tyrosine sulfotransferase
LIDLICSYDDVDGCICSLIESLLLPLAEKYKCRFLSEKTPNNVLIFPELINLFPGALFIYVVRDPRAVIASMRQVGKRAKKVGWKTQDYTQSVLAAISYINQCLNAGFTSYKIAPERVLAVAYERLVSDPEVETKKICKFLKIDWSKQMLYP